MFPLPQRPSADALGYDPEAVAIRPAATVMIVRDVPEFSVLMLRRNDATVFAGGMWVFPGGAVDPADADLLVDRCRGLDAAVANRELGLESGGLSSWIAAVRECFEEAGLLFARPFGETALVDPLSGAFPAHRDALNAREATMAAIAEQENLELDTGAVVYASRWITPVGGPRRFDARFFVASPPEGQVPSHDDSEAVGSEWIRPADGLARFASKEMVMMSPTVRMLQCLDAAGSAASVMALARSGQPDHRARVRYNDDAETYSLVLPGERGYESADTEVENGWVRLWDPDASGDDV